MPISQPTTNTTNKTDLLGFTLPQLEQWFVERGYDSFRAKQLYSWLYKHLVTDFSAMTNLPQALRNRLAQEASIVAPERLQPAPPVDRGWKLRDRVSSAARGRGCHTAESPRFP